MITTTNKFTTFMLILYFSLKKAFLVLPPPLPSPSLVVVINDDEVTLKIEHTQEVHPGVHLTYTLNSFKDSSWRMKKDALRGQLGAYPTHVLRYVQRLAKSTKIYKHRSPVRHEQILLSHNNPAT